MSLEAATTSPTTEIPVDCLDLEQSKKTKRNLIDSNHIYFNYHGSALNEYLENKSNIDKSENLNISEEPGEVTDKEQMNNLKIDLSENYKKLEEKDDPKNNRDMEKELNNNEENILKNVKNDAQNEKEEEEKTNIPKGSKKKLNIFKNQNKFSEHSKENKKENNLNDTNKLDLNSSNEKEEDKKNEKESTRSNLNCLDNSNEKVETHKVNEGMKNNNKIVIEEENNNKENNININNKDDNNYNSHFEKCENLQNEEKEKCNKNNINEYPHNNDELYKTEDKELKKGKKGKNKNKNKNKLFSLFKKKAAPDSSLQGKELCTEENNIPEACTNDNNLNKFNVNNLKENDISEEEITLKPNKEHNDETKDSEENILLNNSSHNSQNNLNAEFTNIHKNKNPFFKRKKGAHKINIKYVQDDHIYSTKTDDHIILDLQEEHRENDGKSTKENKETTEKAEKKIYSFEKIKSFVSNNTFLKDKKSFLIEKKSKISKEVKYFCFNYSIVLCIILYVLCFSFVLISLLSDSWKIHEITLKSKNNEKSVLIHIGATAIRRIQKITEKNGDVYLSIDKEQTMESLINNEFCVPVKKNDMEDYLVRLASENKLKSNGNTKHNEKDLSDDILVSALKNPGDVGLLKDEKLILARKYIFGPTIYNLECKFLEKLKKAGRCHSILLYAILFFLLISIFLLLYILLKYKRIKKIQKLKYFCFVLVNLALITLISSIFSINREYNIPLCVQNDGSSDICQDGKSIHLVRSTIILIIFSNLFFSKFLTKPHNKNNTTESILS